MTDFLGFSLDFYINFLFWLKFMFCHISDREGKVAKVRNVRKVAKVRNVVKVR